MENATACTSTTQRERRVRGRRSRARRGRSTTGMLAADVRRRMMMLRERGVRRGVA
jgi:hypothetical protein